jgi:asparagine synthase (glutamine-hydrolysing)
MCGIAGILSFTDPDFSPLAAMSDAIAHRGPDDAGSFTEAPIALAHRRLSILDLSPRGRQPIWNEAGTVAVVFNGEIYDHVSLRAALEARGHRFASATDTELLVHLYEDQGVAFVEHLDGMYAFALWDRTRQSLLLARDRWGKKPLHYAPIDGGCAFASEVKSLLRHPAVSRAVDPDARHEFLLLGYVPGEASIFESIRKVPAGGVVEIDARGIFPRRGAVPTMKPAEAPLEWNDFLDHVRSDLDRAVARRLVADVEIGVFLSGGVDSSLVAHAAAARRPGLRTFSMGFDSRAFDESGAARRSAEILGTRHQEERMTAKDLIEAIPRVFATFDEPFADVSMIPTWCLARFAATHVKVVLGGDGGDELFGGYPTLRAQRWANVFALLPGATAIASAAASALPDGRGYYPAGYLVRRFASGMGRPPWQRQLAWTAYVPPAEIPEVLGVTDAWPRRLRALAEHLGDQAEIVSHNLDLRLYLADDILVKTDRASMAHGLEARSPFLDLQLAGTALAAPLTYVREKRALRALLGRTPLGDRASVPKRGFTVPVAEWMRGELKPWVEERLGAVANAGVNPEPVRRWWKEHLSERRDRWRELWAILALVEWRAKWGVC